LNNREKLDQSRDNVKSPSNQQILNWGECANPIHFLPSYFGSNASKGEMVSVTTIRAAAKEGDVGRIRVIELPVHTTIDTNVFG